MIEGLLPLLGTKLAEELPQETREASLSTSAFRLSIRLREVLLLFLTARLPLCVCICVWMCMIK